MRALSIKLKLIIFAGTVVALLLIVSASGWLAILSVGDKLDKLSEQSLPSVTALMRMRVWQLEAISATQSASGWDVAAYEAKPDKTTALEDARSFFGYTYKRKLAADAKAQASFDEYAKLPKTEEETVLLKSLGEQWQAYLAVNTLTVGNLKQLSEATEWNLLLSTLKSLPYEQEQAQGASQKIQEQMEKLILLNQSYAAQATDAGRHAQTRAKLLTLIVSGISLLLCAAGAWWVTRSITMPLREAVNVARRVADGDLTAQVKAHSADETGQLMQALKAMNSSLEKIVSQVRTSTDTIATASNEIVSGNQDLSARTERQAKTLKKTASSILELTSTAKFNSDHSREAHQLAISASEVARKGGLVVSQVVDTMDSINASSKQIVDIIAVIDGIAFQTNILALNAAVEAARAGEHGRGFAVVASEVRSLAQRSANAAKEIKGLIVSSVGKIDSGNRLVGQAGATMGEIVASAKKVTDIMSEITAASDGQANDLDQINEAVRHMDEATQQNASLVEQATTASDSMQQLARELLDLVSMFKLHATGEAGDTAGDCEPKEAVRAAQLPLSPTNLPGKSICLPMR